jgi:hypothetical protein
VAPFCSWKVYRGKMSRPMEQPYHSDRTSGVCGTRKLFKLGRLMEARKNQTIGDSKAGITNLKCYPNQNLTEESIAGLLDVDSGFRRSHSLS